MNDELLQTLIQLLSSTTIAGKMGFTNMVNTGQTMDSLAKYMTNKQSSQYDSADKVRATDLQNKAYAQASAVALQNHASAVNPFNRTSQADMSAVMAYGLQNGIYSEDTIKNYGEQSALKNEIKRKKQIISDERSKHETLRMNLNETRSIGQKLIGINEITEKTSIEDAKAHGDNIFLETLYKLSGGKKEEFERLKKEYLSSDKKVDYLETEINKHVIALKAKEESLTVEEKEDMKKFEEHTAKSLDLLSFGRDRAGSDLDADSMLDLMNTISGTPKDIDNTTKKFKELVFSLENIGMTTAQVNTVLAEMPNKIKALTDLGINQVTASRVAERMIVGGAIAAKEIEAAGGTYNEDFVTQDLKRQTLQAEDMNADYKRQAVAVEHVLGTKNPETIAEFYKDVEKNGGDIIATMSTSKWSQYNEAFNNRYAANKNVSANDLKLYDDTSLKNYDTRIRGTEAANVLESLVIHGADVKDLGAWRATDFNGNKNKDAYVHDAKGNITDKLKSDVYNDILSRFKNTDPRDHNTRAKLGLELEEFVSTLTADQIRVLASADDTMQSLITKTRKGDTRDRGTKDIFQGVVGMEEAFAESYTNYADPRIKKEKENFIKDENLYKRFGDKSKDANEAAFIERMQKENDFSGVSDEDILKQFGKTGESKAELIARMNKRYGIDSKAEGYSENDYKKHLWKETKWKEHFKDKTINAGGMETRLLATQSDLDMLELKKTDKKAYDAKLKTMSDDEKEKYTTNEAYLEKLRSSEKMKEWMDTAKVGEQSKTSYGSVITKTEDGFTESFAITDQLSFQTNIMQNIESMMKQLTSSGRDTSSSSSSSTSTTPDATVSQDLIRQPLQAENITPTSDSIMSVYTDSMNKLTKTHKDLIAALTGNTEATNLNTMGS